MDKEPAFVLDRKHVNRMLVYILKVEEVGSMDFSWLTTNWRIIDENLSAMVESGLLSVRIPSKGRKTLRYSLTDMGRCVAIAELLQQECVRGTFRIDDDIIHDDLMRLWGPGGKLRRGISEEYVRGECPVMRRGSASADVLRKGDPPVTSSSDDPGYSGNGGPCRDGERFGRIPLRTPLSGGRWGLTRPGRP